MTDSIFFSQVHALNLSQPDGRTCQSACIAMAVGDPKIYGIRNELERLGDPGSWITMGRVLKRRLGSRYIFEKAASMNDMEGYVKDGELLITHGWFTSSGHVIAIDGLTERPDGRSLFSVKDPWSEFNGPRWAYAQPNVKFFDGNYSDRIIYAACVEGRSRSHAASIYHTSHVERNLKAAWVHRIQPSRPAPKIV